MAKWKTVTAAELAAGLAGRACCELVPGDWRILSDDANCSLTSQAEQQDAACSTPCTSLSEQPGLTACATSPNSDTK